MRPGTPSADRPLRLSAALNGEKEGHGMPVDPTDPDTFREHGHDHDDTDTATDTDTDEDVELGEETPEADAVEQHTEVRRRGDEPLTDIDPATVSEADAVEQARAVDLDEDEDGYR
ncbi:hypothetical protein ACFYYH_04395 [Streptomyces sp. NPDC002018]|uniref:hypothetical protein n=1 Tax=Streptomyces sp. NPDC002018 TaxID=3364629 RepID=UPI0036C5A13A